MFILIVVVVFLIILLGYRWQCETVSIVFGLSFCLVALAEIECQIVLDIVDKFLLILGIETEDFNQAGYLDTLQITVG